MSARRPWARPLAPLYRAGQRLEEALLARGFPRVRTLKWPVVSVGSLSAGGAGKTPVVMALVQLLQQNGWSADVLSRGYGREGKVVERVDAGAGKAASRFGDEPVLMAQRTGAAVWVGSDRFSSGTAAEATAESGERGVHVLDDGFQHRELARAFDVVLVTEEDLDDVLLPAGNLREPLTTLARADAVVVRANEVERVARRVWPLLREGAQMWTVRRELRFPAPLGVLTAGLRPLAFCAIARPESFAAALTAAGCGVIDTVIFRDHQTYGAEQISEITAFAKKLQATGLVTTEKDAVKLSADARERLAREVGPLMVAALDTTFEDEDAVSRALTAALERNRGAAR